MYKINIKILLNKKNNLIFWRFFMEVTNNIYLKEEEVSEITGLALSTLRNNRSKRCGIPFIKIGRSIRYNFEDVVIFMESKRIITEERIKIGFRNN
jgi:hypothetical protein